MIITLPGGWYEVFDDKRAPLIVCRQFDRAVLYLMCARKFGTDAIDRG